MVGLGRTPVILGEAGVGPVVLWVLVARAVLMSVWVLLVPRVVVGVVVVLKPM